MQIVCLARSASFLFAKLIHADPTSADNMQYPLLNLPYKIENTKESVLFYNVKFFPCYKPFLLAESYQVVHEFW